MKKYLVSFKGYRKFQIESQDEATAKLWAEKQNAVFRRKFEATITEIIPEPPKPPAEKDVKAESKDRRTKKNGN